MLRKTSPTWRPRQPGGLLAARPVPPRNRGVPRGSEPGEGRPPAAATSRHLQPAGPTLRPVHQRLGALGSGTAARERHPPAEPGCGARGRIAAPASPRPARELPRQAGGGCGGERCLSRSRRAAAGTRAGPARLRGGGQRRDPGPGARRCRPMPGWAGVRGAHVVRKFPDRRSGPALRGVKGEGRGPARSSFSRRQKERS